MTLTQVKEYNTLGGIKHSEACNKHEVRTQADIYTMPFVGFYKFYNNEGFERERGWVASEGNSSAFGMNKEQAVKEFNR